MTPPLGDVGVAVAERQLPTRLAQIARPRARSDPPSILAIQPGEFGDAGLESTVVLPLTARVVTGDAFPLRVRLQKGSGGIGRESDILVDQMLAWDNSLFRREVGTLPEALQDKVKAALREFLDL